jgi:Tfp pilus assembly protein PilX
MKTDQTQKGQALILIVLAVVGLLALTGLAVDGSAT